VASVFAANFYKPHKMHYSYGLSQLKIVALTTLFEYSKSSTYKLICKFMQQQIRMLTTTTPVTLLSKYHLS